MCPIPANPSLNDFITVNVVLTNIILVVCVRTYATTVTYIYTMQCYVNK